MLKGQKLLVRTTTTKKGGEVFFTAKRSKLSIYMIFQRTSTSFMLPSTLQKKDMYDHAKSDHQFLFLTELDTITKVIIFLLFCIQTRCFRWLRNKYDKKVHWLPSELLTVAFLCAAWCGRGGL